MELTVRNEIIEFNKSIDDFLQEYKENKFIICDKKVFDIYKDEVSNYQVIVFDAIEENKNMETVLSLISQLLSLGFTKGDLLVGFGGGVLTDIVGFIASIIYRGTKHVFIPTTLLSMVDASIGGKCGVDFNLQKNVIGTINEPLKILINTRYLASLPQDELLSGFGEIVKYKYLKHGLSLDKNINEIIYESISIKKEYVEIDLNDNGLRMMLNFGHTFGHQIELKYNLKHGYAVINGIYMILKLEVDLGIIDNKIIEEFISLMKQYKIMLLDLDYKDFLDLIYLDKKNRNGVLNLIFIDENLKPFIYKIRKEELYAKLKITN